LTRALAISISGRRPQDSMEKWNARTASTPKSSTDSSMA
jgi:hypothetical protein